MVRILSAVLVLSAVSASASPAIPSFEFSAIQLQSSIAALRAEQRTAKAGSIGQQITSLTWNLEGSGRDAERLRTDLRWLLQRVRNQRLASNQWRPGQPPIPGQPPRQQPRQPQMPNDPNLRWDLQRFGQDLSQAARDAQWRLADMRNLTAQAEKDETLVAPAQRLLDTTRRFKDATNWLLMDARFGYFDLIRAGYTFEGMDLDRNSRDVDQDAQDLNAEANKLMTKVRGS